MTENREDKKVSIRIPERLHREVEEKLFANRSSFQQLVVSFLDSYAKEGVTVPPLETLGDRFEKWVKSRKTPVEQGVCDLVLRLLGEGK